MSRILLLLIFFFSFTALSAQVLISGTVEHQGSGLDNVTIQVVEESEVLRTIAANKRGKYELDLPIGHRYLLVFRRPYMFPVQLEVNTNLDSESQSDSYEVPLNMSMFYRFEGMRESLAQDNIGTIRQTGTGESTFSFVPNQRAIDNLMTLKEESLRREANAEGAVDKPTAKSVQPNDPSSDKDVSSKESEEVPTASIEDDKVLKTIDLDEPSPKLTRQEERYEAIESAKKIELENERKKLEEEERSFTFRTDAENAYIMDAKRQRAALIEEDQERQASLVDAAVRQQESQIEGLVRSGYSRKPAEETREFEIVKFSSDDGWIIKEEKILVKVGDHVDTYRKVMYDWLVLDWVYYYLNEEEISEEEYERIKSQVEM